MFIISEFMYIFECMNLLLNCFYVFIYYYFETCLLLYPFYDLMIFIYEVELKKAV